MAQANPIVDPVVSRRRVGGLEVGALLSRGGMADVHLAGDVDDTVVVKRVRADLEGTPQEARLSALLTAEARLTECLRHPNIVRVLGHGVEEGQPFLVLEYVEGMDLHALLASCSSRRIDFPLSLRLAVLCSVLRALDYAHRARDERGALFEVVHRDVSPANVLIGFGGAVKLCDFGIASATVMPEHDEIDGKASYMSPEHARGEATDQRADIYACGILLWELLAGRRMRRGDGRFERARRGEVPPLALRGLPEEARLLAIVERALALDPEDRHPTAGAMMLEIERWCRDHRLLAGESEIGRFMRQHFADRRAALAALRKAPAPLEELREVDCTPTHSGTRPRLLQQPPAALTPPREPAGWLAATPVLLASAALTFVVLVLLAALGVF